MKNSKKSRNSRKPLKIAIIVATVLLSLTVLSSICFGKEYWNRSTSQLEMSKQLQNFLISNSNTVKNIFNDDCKVSELIQYKDIIKQQIALLKNNAEIYNNSGKRVYFRRVRNRYGYTYVRVLSNSKSRKWNRKTKKYDKVLTKFERQWKSLESKKTKIFKKIQLRRTRVKLENAFSMSN